MAAFSSAVGSAYRSVNDNCVGVAKQNHPPVLESSYAVDTAMSEGASAGSGS